MQVVRTTRAGGPPVAGTGHSPTPSVRGHADTRLLAGNALYTELIALCAVGKALYATTDARKFQDYIVNETPDLAVAPVPPVA